MENSKIEWTDHTFNPWEGCTKVSPGCLHCYAETRNARFGGGTAPNWGRGKPRRRTSKGNWSGPLQWNRDAIKTKSRPRVFCASLADWLDDEVPIEWLADLLERIYETPNLDWLLLTKRPANWRPRLTEARDYVKAQNSPLRSYELSRWLNGEAPPANVWVGTSVEDQTRADERIPLLLQIPAKVRFLSCEPLLGPVDLHGGEDGDNGLLHGLEWAMDGRTANYRNHHSKIHWVIAGGESGPGARPMHPDWARGLRDQCAAAGVPFLFKQWGEYREVDDRKMGLAHTIVDPASHPAHAARVLEDVKSPAWVDINGKLYTKLSDLPKGIACRLLDHCGKKAAGRLLDNKEHTAYPA